MAEEAVITPAEAVTPEVEKAQTISEVIEAVSLQEKKPETVGLDKFLELKRENKEMRQSMKAIQDKVDAGASDSQVSADIKAYAEEYGVDTKSIEKILDMADRRAEEKYGSKLKSVEEGTKASKIQEAFSKHFGLAMENMPEYTGIVNPDVIKTLSLQPQNANKTFKQLIEETYSGALTGKRTMDTTTPGGGKDAEPLDFKKANSDVSYFEKVMNDPKLKAEYNAKMLRTL